MTATTHPTIKGLAVLHPLERSFFDAQTTNLLSDGWFQEINDLWPGQAMTLKVNQILHHEKSKYQDILIFESSDHGTVLILDNVIQCTEQDEFAYVGEVGSKGPHVYQTLATRR